MSLIVLNGHQPYFLITITKCKKKLQSNLSKCFDLLQRCLLATERLFSALVLSIIENHIK